jgi:dihydroorotate dehydrogenase (fumarate)
MVDLSTAYLGLKLKSPLVVSSSPLTESPETIQRLEEAGAAAVVLPSIFEEQLTLESDALDRDLNRGTESFAESLSYFPEYEDYRQGQDVYLSQIQRAKSACSIPVLASLNGATARGWVRFAKEIEQAGADALELNTYSLATDASETSAIIEKELVQLVRQVKAATGFRLRSSCLRSTPAFPTWPWNSIMPAPMRWSCSTVFTSRTSIWRTSTSVPSSP